MASYPPPSGPARAPVVFVAQEVKPEPTDYDEMVPANVVKTVPQQPGNPGAAFRANPQVWRGTKQTFRMGQARKILPYKAAVKSSYPY